MTKLSFESYQAIMISLDQGEDIAKKWDKAKVKYFQQAREEVKKIGIE